jgi:hypothetical protein
MKHKLTFSSLLPMALFLALAPTAMASPLYVDGVNGNDNNDCKTAQTACKTIGHGISLAKSWQTIMVAPATYTENLSIGISLKILGSDASTTIIDGGQVTTVVTIAGSTAVVTLSKLTIRNGVTSGNGGGVNNSGTLTINNSTISGNVSTRWGGGVVSSGSLTINNSTLSNNSGYYGGGIAISDGGTTTINKSTLTTNRGVYGGAIANLLGYLAINKSTATSNWAGQGGGIYNHIGRSNTTITNSTISGNTANALGGGIASYGRMTINNSTISNNGGNGGIYIYGDNIYVDNYWGGESMTLQNTVVGSSGSGGNCFTSDGGTITSDGYNLSSDNTCNFTNTGDMNNTRPMIGKLGNYGGPTQTVRLLLGSPAIDAGNPNGCTDGNGNLLKTDQRGYPRPGRKDTGGCDIGAFERQID